MQSFVAAIAFAGAAYAYPSAVSSAVAPQQTAPAGCSANYPGTFEISIVNVTTSAKRSTALEVTMANGVLTDAEGRTGYIAANNQFQFDGPPQAGAKFTAGFSACANGTLALGDSAIFYKCLSGTFYNLYDDNESAQCSPVYIDIIGGGSTAGGASEVSDGQFTAAPTVASQISDGQVTATPAAPPVTQISDGQVQASTGAPVTQISDGQIQATTGTAAPVTQISDGQIQATTGAPVTQITDGQIQAPTATMAPVTQITDGQIQAPTGAPVSQISDGQIQAPTNGTNPSSASATIQPFAGGAAIPTAAPVMALAAGLLALAAL